MYTQRIIVSWSPALLAQAQRRMRCKGIVWSSMSLSQDMRLAPRRGGARERSRPRGCHSGKGKGCQKGWAAVGQGATEQRTQSVRPAAMRSTACSCASWTPFRG